MNSPVIQTISEIALPVVFIVAVGWFLWRWLKGTQDPGALILRWVLTVAAFYYLWRLGNWMSGRIAAEDSSATLGVLGAAAGGMFLAVVWVPAIVDWFSRKIGSLYDGGQVEVDAKPFYSVFQAKRTKGKYFEALAEVRRQLDRFPTDFEGQMLLSELQAENLNDLPGAEITIHRLCQQPGHAPLNISFALNKLADWHLSVTKDRDAARNALERIIQLLPDTEMSLQASQRIARLADTETLLAPHQRQKVVMKKGVENLGLLQAQGHLKPAETDPGLVAAEYVKHLEQHPLDTHAREQLAVIYASHYHRLDLALDQLEQLVQQPNHPAKRVVHWLNLMADLQIQENAAPELVRPTLQRIVDAYPDLPAAVTAQRRMDTLKLEFNSRKTGHQVHLGVYEQNIGLKGRASAPVQRLKGELDADDGSVPGTRLDL
jgi:tetratricopeptide (TPR) repeat protein